MAAWCPSCGAPVKTEAHRGRWGQDWSQSPLLSAHPSHHHYLLVKMLLGDLSMDVLVLLGKHKLSAAGLGPGVPPESAPALRVISARGIGSRHSPVKGASPAPQRGLAQAQMNWRGAAAGTPRRGCAAAFGNSRVPRGCCAADPEPARSVRAETAGTCSNTPT